MTEVPHCISDNQDQKKPGLVDDTALAQVPATLAGQTAMKKQISALIHAHKMKVKGEAT